MTNTVNSIEFTDIPLFSNLKKAQKKEISRILQKNTYSKGEFIFFEGDSCNRIVILKSGQIKVFRTSINGKEQIIEILNPGDTCACNPGFDNWNCSSSSQALSDCELWILHRKDYINLIQNNHEMAIALSHIFANKLCMLSSLLHNVSLDNPFQRLIKYLLNLADEAKPENDKEITLKLQMSQEDIANQLGVTRVTVARGFQKLKSLNLISQKSSQIIISDRKKLIKALTESN